jgi:lipopolysaccharide exporter
MRAMNTGQEVRTAMEDVSRKMARGAAWMVAVRLADRGLGLVNTMILARLLVPQDFGLVAMATALLGMIEIMSAFSFDLALIQNRKADRRHYDTAWTFNVLFGAFTGVVLAVLAVPAAHFFSDPRVEAIVYVLAAAAFMQSFQNIGIVAFRKELDFRKEFILLALQKAVAVVATLILAYALRNYWALVIGILISKVASVAVSYWIHPYRARFSLAASRELMRFSSWMLLNNMVVFAAVKGYDFIIGRLAGAHGLGLYSVAYEISNLPTTELVNPVSRAIFPGFSKLTDDPGRLRTAFLRVAALAALITFPAGAGIAALAEPLVHLLLGAQWMQAAPLIQILAIYGVMRALHAGTGDVYLALGVHRVIALINLPHMLVGWPVMIYLYGKYGIEGAAWSVLCASAVGVALNVAIILRVLELKVSDLVGCYWRPLVAVAAMLLVVNGLTRLWPPAASTGALALQVTAYVLAGAVTFGGTLLMLWIASQRPDGAERVLLDRLAPRKLVSFAGNG